MSFKIIRLLIISLTLFTLFHLNSPAIITYDKIENRWIILDENSSEIVQEEQEPIEISTTKLSPSAYAQQLFDLLAIADKDENEEISKDEYFSWNANLQFSEDDAKIQFEDMDKNNDGIMTLGEYFVYVNRFWTNSKAYIRETFKDADKDLNGNVSRQEYLDWHQSFENTTQADIELEFMDDDRNQDGRITVDDFEMSTFLQKADTNLDGILSLNEYLEQTSRYLTSNMSPAIERIKDETDFREMDTDKDGFLSLQELEDDML